MGPANVNLDTQFEYEEKHYGGITIDDIRECRNMPRTIPSEELVDHNKELSVGSIIGVVGDLPFIENVKEEGAHPFYVRFSKETEFETTNFLIAEDCFQNELFIMPESEYDISVKVGSDIYTDVQEEFLDGPENLSYTKRTHPMYFIGVSGHNSPFIHIDHKEWFFVSDEWLISELDVVQSDIIRYFL